MNVLWDFVLTLGLLGLIVLACSWFTNGIEWIGHRYKLSEGAVGSVLAAVGTALPETLVPIVAIFSGAMASSNISQSEGHEIGIGAILGAPFLLSTLAMFVSGVAVLFYAWRNQRSTTMKLDAHLTRRDFLYFFAAYIPVFMASFIAAPLVKNILAVGLVVFYGIYVYRTMTKEHIPDSDFHIDPLFMAPRTKEPTTGLIFLQTFISLLGIIFLAHLFVDEVSHLSQTFGIDALVLSLIITPIATELPEKFNSVVWISKGKDTLALGNMTGAMVFQSCIPTAVGLAFTPWVLSDQAALSVWLCLASSILLFFFAFSDQKKTAYWLLLGGAFYAVFIWYSLRLVEGGHY